MFWGREQKYKEATGEVNEFQKERKKEESVSYLIQRKTRRGVVASKTPIVPTATAVVCDDDVISGTLSSEFKH